MKDTKLKAHSCSALAVKKPKTQEKRRRRRQIKKLQWQLQWRGMWSKLEKGIKGKKNERFWAQISVIRYQVRGVTGPFFSYSSSFSFSFFFLFVLVRNIFTSRNSQISPIQQVFFPIRNKGSTYIGALASTVYIGRTGRYDMKLTSFVKMVIANKWWMKNTYVANSDIKMLIFMPPICHMALIKKYLLFL